MGETWISDPYSRDDIKQQCLRMYVNGMGFRGIERVIGVHHTTVIYWVKQVRNYLPDAYAPNTIPQVGELDPLFSNAGLSALMDLKQTATLAQQQANPSLCIAKSKIF